MSDEKKAASSYAQAGVDTDQAGASVARLVSLFHPTFDYRNKKIGRPLLPLGHFANVLDLGNGQGLAIATDGVGTKLLVAEMLGKYDTVGIDCVAMNVNDLICIGAEPISFVDYIACEKADPDLLYEVAKGLAEGARQSRVAIPGGEIAQVAEMIRGCGEGRAIDLVGTAVGIVAQDRIITGKNVEAGDALIGFPSSGIHSNGFTLARRTLFDSAGLNVRSKVDELSQSVGEELLIPTKIYVAEVLDLFEAGVDVRCLVHITGDGLLNLRRIEASVGFSIETLPPIPPIFSLIQRLGGIEAAEMFEVFNMGIGLVVSVPEHDVDKTLEIARQHGTEAIRIGTVTNDPTKTVHLHPKGLKSSADGGFVNG